MKRLIAILLAVIMLLSLTACGDNQDPTVTKDQNNDQGNGTTTTAPAAESSKWDNVNFNGETIIISLSDHAPSFAVTAGAEDSVKYIKGPDTYTTDPVQNAVYDRNKNISSKLGLDVQYQICSEYNSAAPATTLTIIEGFVLADLEDAPDIISTMGYGMIRAGIKGDLYNTLTTQYENYFDFTANGWYSDFMYENTLDNSKVFMLAGDYFIDILRYGYAMLVNIDMYDEVFASEGGVDSLFEIINEGNWNYDELMRAVQMAHVDGGEIGLNDSADTFGAVNNSSWLMRTTFATSGLEIFDYDENGKLRYKEDITDVHNFIDRMIQVTSTEGFYLNNAPTYYVYTDIFTDGRALFSFDAPVLQMEGSVVQNMEDKVAIVPYPKYNPDDEYSTLVSDCANFGGIAYNSDKFTECSAFLQMANEESNNGENSLIHQYYEVTLKYKLSNTPEQIKMLEYIRNGLCSPKSMLYDNYFAQNVGMKMFFQLANTSVNSGVNSFASDWASQYNSVQQSLEQTVASYGVQD